MHNIVKKYLSDKNRKAAVAKWKGMTSEERAAHIRLMNKARMAKNKGKLEAE